MPTPRAKPHRRVRDLGPVRPYLGGELRTAFDAWLDATVARHTTELSFREIRKGAQALSSLYVERRDDVDLSARTLEGHGKRAALATYYAPLHFLTAHHGLSQIGVALGDVRRVVDLGAGTGATGASVAHATGARELVAIDRSGFALSEARGTYAAFGLLASVRRGRIPDALPRPDPGDVWVLGWSANEMSDRERTLLLGRIEHAIGRGAALVLFEPLAGAAVPWWRDWRDALTSLGVADFECKTRVALPEWIARLDRATALDHRVLGGRALVGPV